MTKKIKCKDCNGRGLLKRAVECKKCKGKGFIYKKYDDYSKPIRTKCPSCDGKGKHRPRCRLCEGFGWYKLKEKKVRLGKRSWY